MNYKLTYRETSYPTAIISKAGKEAEKYCILNNVARAEDGGMLLVAHHLLEKNSVSQGFKSHTSKKIISAEIKNWKQKLINC